MMFGIKKLIQRIQSLEWKVEEMRQKERCAGGTHEWEARDLSANISKPYIRCKHCYTKPQEKAA
jgi:hypothetical protein